MSNLENAPITSAIEQESPPWIPLLFTESDAMDVDSPAFTSSNYEQDYAIESQYTHIQSPDFAPLASPFDMQFSSVTFASSTRNTSSIFAPFANSSSHHTQALNHSNHRPLACTPIDALMRTPADFSISPHTSNDVISPFGKKFELSDDWLVSGSYISPVIHATRTKKPTVRLISSSPTMSFMDRLQTQYSSSHAPPRHGVPSSSPLLSPFLHSRPSVKKEKLPHPPLRVQAPADDVRLPTLTLPPSRRLLPKFKKLPSPRERRTSPQPAANLLFLISPLSPLTPSPTKSAFLTENACPPVSDPKRKKRSLSMSESPTTRVKRTRYNPRGADTLGHDASPLPGLSLTKTAAAGAPLFSTRTLPSAASFVVSPYFPLFYRRFPVSSYFRPGTTRSPCTLFGMPHPGGEYQAPRNAFDLYAPRFVKGKGSDKVALCPICVEAPRRGGEGKKVWLAVKFSAFDCHMQYHHGISASTRRPLSPPIDFRIVARPSPKQLERTEVQQAKCHKCLRWVAIKTIKDVDMKVKELLWWKHAAACHSGSVLKGEGRVFEEDRVYEVLKGLSGGTC